MRIFKDLKKWVGRQPASETNSGSFDSHVTMGIPETEKCIAKPDKDDMSVKYQNGTKDVEMNTCVQDNETRGVWGNKLEFFLAIMGYTVGMGSIWRFPITCSRNGGGAFLVPFFFFLITAGGPLYYMEVCLGQFTGKSAGLSFEYCPLFKGIGFLQVSLSSLVLWYCMTVSTWVYYYLYASFHSTLPWATCGNTWNTPYCTVNGESNITLAQNGGAYNTTSTQNVSIEYRSSAFEFWEYKVITRSRGLEDMGSLQPHLVICAFIGWLFIVLAVIKGVKTLGKVVYITATLPYLFLTVMLIRGLTLPGSLEGIKKYVTPDFYRLLDINVWLEAAIQVFYSLGPTWGGVITMASYNKFHQKSFWSTFWCVASSGFTSFFNGLVVFTILGFMAQQSGLSIEKVAQQSGPGLTFVAFPIALSQMPLPQLWSVLFFCTLVLVIFDSMFGMFETVTSGMIDLFPRQLTSRRVLVNLVCGLLFFVTGLPLCMDGGIYIFQLADWYFARFALLFGSLMECVTISWIYGSDRFSRDIAIMTGRDVSVLLRCFWTLVIPIFLLIAIVVTFCEYTTPSYGDGYVYSTAALVIGVITGMVPIIGMFFIALVQVLQTQGPLMHRIQRSLQPSSKWLPNDEAAQQDYILTKYVYAETWWRRFMLNVRGTKTNPVL